MSAAAMRLRDNQGLSEYLNRDLTKLDKPSQRIFKQRLKELVGKAAPKEPSFGLNPAWVKPYRVGKIKWLCLQIYPGYSIPDVSGLEADSFDVHWNLVRQDIVPTGYRKFFSNQKLFTDSAFSQPLLTIGVVSAGPFTDQRGKKPIPAFDPESGIQETFAFSESGATLIRLQDGDGHFLAGDGWQPPSIGPDTSKRSAATWKADLASQDPIRQLGCLVWLAGFRRIASSQRGPNDPRPTEGAAVAEVMGTDSGVRRRVKELRQSQNLWVKRQAVFTFDQLDGSATGE